MLGSVLTRAILTLCFAIGLYNLCFKHNKKEENLHYSIGQLQPSVEKVIKIAKCGKDKDLFFIRITYNRLCYKLFICTCAELLVSFGLQSLSLQGSGAMVALLLGPS
jgi:hypothetical protein